MEVWKDIEGYEGLYQVSNLGRVKSLKRYVLSRGSKRWKPEKKLKAGKDNKGYLMVVLCNDKNRWTVKVHRLVAEAFLCNPEHLPQVNHKDGNKANNSVENLEWCTQSVNMTHAWLTGLQPREHKKNDKKSIKIAQYTPELQFVSEYPSMMEAERRTGIFSTSIARSAKKGGKAGGYIWRYA